LLFSLRTYRQARPGLFNNRIKSRLRAIYPLPLDCDAWGCGRNSYRVCVSRNFADKKVCAHYRHSSFVLRHISVDTLTGLFIDCVNPCRKMLNLSFDDALGDVGGSVGQESQDPILVLF